VTDQAQHDLRVDYVEFPTTDVAAVRAFYERVFGWKFTDWGEGYTSFADGRLAGGFQAVDSNPGGGPLVVLYAVDLEAVQRAIIEAGGSIVRPTFEFPGGRRFHFADPGGNELAVWSEA
jgi:predicted enzyme related to lactoylglutathione lyase